MTLTNSAGNKLGILSSEIQNQNLLLRHALLLSLICFFRMILAAIAVHWPGAWVSPVPAAQRPLLSGGLPVPCHSPPLPFPFFPVIGSGKADISEQSIYQSGLKSQMAG